MKNVPELKNRVRKKWEAGERKMEGAFFTTSPNLIQSPVIEGWRFGMIVRPKMSHKSLPCRPVVECLLRQYALHFVVQVEHTLQQVDPLNALLICSIKL